MLFWIENAPTLETNSEREIVQFVDKLFESSKGFLKTKNKGYEDKFV